MINYIYIGSTPCDEECAQVGRDDYYERSRKELKRFISGLRSFFGPEPAGARFTVKWQEHDFGTYGEVVCEYDDTNMAAVAYAYAAEDAPRTWEELES